MMVKWSVANSSAGAAVISTRSALLAAGSTCAAVGLEESRLPTVVVIASVRSSPLMDVLVLTRVLRVASCHYGMGGLGTGGTPQIAVAQGGRGGVGIRNSFPWVDAEPPVMHVPVKLVMLGYGVAKPSVRACRKITIWFSSRSVKPRLPVVVSILFLTSGIGQQSTFSVVPAGQCPDVTGTANRSRVL